MQKEAVQRKIDFLKKDIQYLIDKKKRTNAKIDQDIEKQQKLNELETLTQTLSKLEKDEASKKKRNRELKAVSNAINTLEYKTVQKLKTPNAIQKANQAKEEREIAKNKYAQYLVYEKEYLKYDPPEFPGFLFLHNNVLEKYGVCPHIKIMTDNIHEKESENSDGHNVTVTSSSITRELKKSREDWLSKTIDKGQTLYDLRDKVVLKKNLQELEKTKDSIQNKINDMISLLLTEKQYTLWSKCLLFIKEYIDSNIKTKKLKERFNYLINDLSLLFSETNLPLHQYLNCIHKNILFVVNSIDSTVKTPVDEVHINQFDEYISQLKTVLDDINNENKSVSALIQNLKNELYLFISEQKTFTHHNKEVSGQQGKYFKKWSTMTEDERFDRFESYAAFFIDRFMINTGILDKKKRDENIKQLSSILQEGYKNKNLTYRNFKWNVKVGIIENINILKYNKENGHFYLLNTKPIVQNKTKSKVDTNSQEETGGSGGNGGSGSSGVSKRKSSAKSFIGSTNEAMVNEIILTFVIKNMSKIISNEVSKEDCAEEVKTKMYLKKLSTDDKSKIFSRYDLITKTVN